MSLFGITKHPFQSGKVINFPAPPSLMRIAREAETPKPQPAPENGLLAAHTDSSIFSGAQQIAPSHAEDIVMGNGVNSLGLKTIQLLSDMLMQNQNGLNDVIGSEISAQLTKDISTVAERDLPYMMQKGFNMALDALKLGGFMIDDFKEEMFSSLMNGGAMALTQTHMKLINENDNYSRRFI